jgi:integrase
MESERENVRKVVLRDSDYPALRDSFADASVRLLFLASSHVGIRASELKRITWDQIDLDRKVIRLERGKTKNKDPRSAQIFGDMVEALITAKRERDEFYPDSPWVFSRAGEPIKDFRTQWTSAAEAAGVPDLHFHDLRRTAQRLMRRAAHRQDHPDANHGSQDRCNGHSLALDQQRGQAVIPDW